ncbi:MAG: hypothetical protein K8R92_10200 [Planctomycetes bacterium]|nr:hypothetical protein [Planctomycetota bacterium]
MKSISAKSNSMLRALALCGLGAALSLAACSSQVKQVPVATAWKDIDVAESGLKKATKKLQEALMGAAKDMNITNAGDLGSSALRQNLLRGLQKMQAESPAAASSALLARTRVQGAIQDLRRDAGALQVGMIELVSALQRGETNPPERDDMSKTMSRIKVEAEGAVGLINYAEQISAQLERLGS